MFLVLVFVLGHGGSVVAFKQTRFISSYVWKNMYEPRDFQTISTSQISLQVGLRFFQGSAVGSTSSQAAHGRALRLLTMQPQENHWEEAEEFPQRSGLALPGGEGPDPLAKFYYLPSLQIGKVRLHKSVTPCTELPPCVLPAGITFRL